MPSLCSWRPSARTAFIRAFTVHTVLRRAPGREGCGVRGAGAHHPGVFRHVDRGDPLVDLLVLLVVDYLRSAHRGHLLGLACGITASCPGVRSAGTRPGILTGVLEATLRDPQVTTPAPSYDPGSHSKKSRRRGQPAPTVPIPHGGTNPGPDAAEAQPAPTRTGLGFSRSATIPR